MTVREKYWAMYETVKFSERYFFFYREGAITCDTRIKAFLVLSSLSCIANLTLWENIPFVWALISAVAQIVSAIMYLFPYSDQVTALNFLLPELDILLNHIDHDWDRINTLAELSDSEINDLVLDYNLQYSNLESKYIGNTPFPRKNKCTQKATEDCKQFRVSRFGSDETEHLEEAVNNGNK